MSVTDKPDSNGQEESSPNIGQNGGISETPANGIGAVTEDNISLDEHVTSRELLEEVPLHVETGAAPKKSSKRQKARSLSSSKGERRHERRRSSGSLVLEPFKKVIRRLSQDNLLTDGGDPSGDYSQIVLGADTQSPMFYAYDVNAQPRSRRNDDHILILLLILFCPIGGFVPLIVLLMAHRERDREKRWRLHSKGVKFGKCIILFGIAVAIVSVLAAIVVIASVTAPKNSSNSMS